MRGPLKFIAILWLLILAGCAPQTPERIETTTSITSSGHLRIAFWNIRDFSNNKADPQLEQIASIAPAFDCLAICELNGTVILPRLCRKLEKLGGQWSSVQTPHKIGNTPNSSEFYGFVFRTDRLKLKGGVKLLPELTYD